MNPVIQQVTDRIAARSEKSRALYLQRMEQARAKGPHRGALACGNLAHGLTHPSSEVNKIYLARIKGAVTKTEISALTTGIELSDGFAKADTASIVGATPGETAIEISLHEGRNRIIRRMCEHIGHEVIQLVRVQFGPIKLGDMKLGKTRVLNHTEVGSLYRAAQLEKDEAAL